MVSPSPAAAALAERVRARAADLNDELVAFRRDLHAHPELSRAEHRTTDRVATRLEAAGLTVRRLEGTGLICDIRARAEGPSRGMVALRADLDALPLTEVSGLGFASTVRGVAHACGHDMHTAVVLGAGLVLAELAAEGELHSDVRLIFQPAEEVQPGGALDVMRAGGLEGVEAIFALHCDPKFDVGQVGTRIGPITSASDTVTVTLSSTGGHTSRPHLAGDLVAALGHVITAVPAMLTRRIDPRSGVNLTWGAVRAGNAPNAIPSVGSVTGTLRCLDARAWAYAQEILVDVAKQVVAPTGVEVDVQIVRGVPPVDNDEKSVRFLDDSARTALGPDSLQLTEQSLGGEDFAWYLTEIKGAMARLGTRTPGGRTYDLHRPDVIFDEDAIGVGVRLLTQAAARAGRER
ncbi:amidohydrolase [Pseudactinotalea sp. Z1748]|uniref:amidohydrolase n=1 Tax=Pseudactinotalea sp. Z1748 TaxID=3413027 RepID=UPI003C7A72FD